MSTSQTPGSGNARKGFASMTPEKRSRVGAMGGKAAQASGKAHRFTGEEARAAAAKSNESKKRARPG